MSPRSRLVLIVAVGVLTCALLAVGALVGYVVWAQRKISRDVSYEVTGTARALQITYVSGDDPYQRQKATDSTLPWTKSFHTETMTAHAGVTAVLAPGETGTVSCTLRVDGKVVATQTSGAGSRIASCFESD